MTAATLTPDSTRCPDCSARLTGRDLCPACGLRLTGPEATRLWEVDVELLGLESARGALLSERAQLLHALRAGASRTGTWASPADGGAADAPADGVPAQRAPVREVSAAGVQDLLLTLGGLLLAGAALVFAVVTYERLGATGRALVLAALTVAAAAAAPRLRTRGLGSTAEAVGALALALAALDAYGLRTLGLAADSDPAAYAAGSAAALAALAGGFSGIVPLRVVRVAAVLLSQLPVPLLLVSAQASAPTAAVALAALAAVDLAVLAAGRRLPVEVRTALVCGATTALLVALLAALPTAYLDDAVPGAAAVTACAGVLAGAAALAAQPLRDLLSGAVVLALGAAAAALVRDDAVLTALVLAAVGLLAALAGGQLPAAVRTGPVCGALLLATGAVLLVAEPVAQALLRPLIWVDAPWSATAADSAREALGPQAEWTASAATPLVLALAALGALVAGRSLPGAAHVAARAAGAALGTAAAVLVPVALDLPLPAALALVLALGAGLAAAGVATLGRREAPALVFAGTALALHCALWSLAAQSTTLVVLPVVAVLCGALAATRVPAAALLVLLAGLLGTGELTAAGVVADLSPDQLGALLVPGVALLAGAAALLDAARRPGAEAAAHLTSLVALALTAGDAGWLSWTFAGLGLIALATALHPERRAAAVLGALLLSASSWVRLADAGVTAPEPYVLPLAAAALLLGHLRRRSDPSTSSWACAPGLSLGLVPSLLASLEDETLTRSLLVGLAALAVLLAGARGRLQAPLVVGAAVLAVVALDLVGPYAVALPRWLSLGTAGALLLVVGATYEQRRRDLERLRERYDALA